MKHYFLTLLFLSISTVFFSQEIRTQKINSRILNQERYLKIYIPQSYKLDSTRLYPITVVLDAEYLFDVYASNATLFARKDEAPEQIIVGINQNHNNERFKDCSANPESSLPTEAGMDFYNFVRSELLDYMEQNYRTSPFKTIVGNALTANFTNYFFLENYPSFNAFININPYYENHIPTMLKNKAHGVTSENVYYYLSNGNNNSEKIQTKINEANNLLDSIPNQHFKYKYDAFNNNSTATIGQSIPSALTAIFELYSSISPEEFDKNIKNMSPPDAIAYLEKKYVEIEYLFGTNLKIREKDIFTVEKIILDKENGDYLKSFGEMINKLYKDSPMGDYYIGRYYETGKNYKLALRYYKNGYMKLPENDPNEDNYYENIRRVIDKKAGLIDDSAEEDIKEEEILKEKN